MNGFLKTTFTRQKFQGLFLNTALGNFAGYIAGSLVTLAATRSATEGRAVRNLFGLLPRKRVVVHLMPHWLEWLVAVLVGFLVMEAVRYCFSFWASAASVKGSGSEPLTQVRGQGIDGPQTAQPPGPGSGVACLQDRPG
jgi:hypothetical protein